MCTCALVLIKIGKWPLKCLGIKFLIFSYLSVQMCFFKNGSKAINFSEKKIAIFQGKIFFTGAPKLESIYIGPHRKKTRFCCM